MKLNYFKLLDKVGNDMGIVPVHLSRASMVEDAVSTGSLVADLITGGGWPAGRWVALFGPEASCKSTLLYHTIGDSIRQDINAEFFDFEGSTDPSYLKKILNVDLNNVFGLRKDVGTWEITPQCRYHQPDLGEPYFRYMHRILKILPDKVQNNGQWYYVYDKKPKEAHDVKLYKNTGRFWVPAQDGSLQIIWFIDSLPAMLTEKQDEKDESKEIGLQARMFSKNIPLIKSRLARKRCSVVAVNQIRLKPMAFGNPEYEPGGEAPKFYCFAEDTYLQTDKGLIKASDAYLETPNKILGEEFLEKPNLYRYMGKSDTIKITTDYGFELKGKLGHSVLALNNRTLIDWTKLSDLTKQHFISIKVGSEVWPENPPILDFKYEKAKRDFSSIEISLPKKMTLELARFLGYLTSEGYTKAAEGGNYNIVFTKGDNIVMSDFCRLFEILFAGVDYHIVDKENTKQFITQNCHILRFLEYLGAANKPARLKTVPWCVLQSPREYVVEFLIGYFVGDISINEKEACIASASREMLKQIQLLLLNMGIVSRRGEYRSTWFSPLDERNKYSQLYFSGENLLRLVSNVQLPSKKGQVNITADRSYLYDRLPILQHWLDVRLVADWVKKYGKQNGKYFHIKDITEKALNDFQDIIDRKIANERKVQGTQLLSNIQKLIEYQKIGIFFVKIENVEYSSEQIATFDANMPNHTILTNGIISHNSDIRLQCRSCSNPFAKGQIEEEPCWDGIGVDKYRYVKICTRKNKCFSPFRESLMRIWMEEKGDTGRGLDPVFDTFQYLKETGQIVEEGRGTKKVLRLTIAGVWTQRTWTYKEFKELILNPNKAAVYIKFNLNDPNIGSIEDNPTNQTTCAAILNLREVCKKQIRSNEAFDLYFKTICNGGPSEAPKTCSMCAHFRKLENCMDVKPGQEGCDDWISEEQEEEESPLEDVGTESEI